MRITAIDPSLTATAVCRVDTYTGAPPRLDVSRTKPAGSTLVAKLERMGRQVEFVVGLAAGADLVVMEAPSLASAGRATRDLAGLWWLMFASLLDLASVELGVVPPTVLKKWATGAGNADKFRVGQAVAKRWPDVDLRSDDEADALALAGIGLHRAGELPWSPTVFQVEALAKVEWCQATDSTSTVGSWTLAVT